MAKNYVAFHNMREKKRLKRRKKKERVGEEEGERNSQTKKKKKLYNVKIGGVVLEKKTGISHSFLFIICACGRFSKYLKMIVKHIDGGNYRASNFFFYW